jgi:PmbA protein
MTSGKELAQSAVRLARKRGADQAEALVIRQHERAVNVFDHQAQLSGETEVTRVTIRLFRDNRGGVAIGHGCSERVLEEMVGRAFSSLPQTAPDKFLGVVDAKNLGRVNDDLKIFDQPLADLALGGMTEIALTAESAIAQKEPRLASVISSSFQTQNQDVALCTSEGFDENYQTTTATLLTSAVTGDYYNDEGGRNAPTEDSKLSGGAAIVTHSLGGLDFEKAAQRTIRQLSGMAGAKPSPSGYFPIVLAPTAARRITQMFLQMCSGPIVTLMKGSMMGRLGERICSPVITLIDDATLTGGIRTVPFDHEGVMPRRQTIIEKGVFREYLLNNYYARALDRDSTGNAIANNEVRFSVRPSNAYIEPGDVSPESILADIRQGFYITMFLSPNSQLQPLSANFAQAVAGFWIENGKLTHPVRAATISAPFREMLNKIEAVGSDLDHDAAVISPTMLFGKMNVSPLI